MACRVFPIDVGIRFNIAFDTGFTPILTFPHRWGRDYMTHLNTFKQYRLPLPSFAVVRYSEFPAICMAHFCDGRYDLGSE